VKFAIISDAHLFQSYLKKYDPIYDFRAILQKIKQDDYDALLIAGDMFDCKKTASTYLRHYEGEGLMMKVREVLKEIGISIYALRGNHEKEEVMKGLDQTVDNFHYVKNDWARVGGISIFFMDTHFEGELYEPNAISQIIKQVLSSEKPRGKRILLSHETFEPFPNALPREVIEEASKSFDWIINGHMHMWNRSAYNFDNVITLPSLLPSRLRMGTYWTERYTFSTGVKKPKFERKESPFGYAILDTEKGSIEHRPVTPSKKIVEISLDVTEMSLKDVLDRFREIFSELDGKKDRESYVVLPEIHGLANFATSFVAEVFKEYPDLNIEQLKNSTSPSIMTTSGKSISAPRLDPEQLFEEVEKELGLERDELLENVGIELSMGTLGRILYAIRDSGLIERLPPRTTTRLETLFNEIIILLDIEKPETFDSDMKNIIKRVKE